MRAFIFFVIFATSLAITTGRVANRACPTKVVPTCKDGIYCKNLIKDKNGCPGADFCAATSADCKSRGGKLATRKACPTKLVPTCKDGVSCKNLKKDKNGGLVMIFVQQLQLTVNL